MIAPNDRAPGTRTIFLRILRQDSPEALPRWERFQVEVETGMNLISCLQRVAANPVTVEGDGSTPVVFDCGCLEEVCGSCTMVINGKVRQSCTALVDEYAPREGDEIVLEPMSKFPVVRDLMVDRERLFHNLKRVKAWVPIDGTYDLGAGPIDTPDHQQMRYTMATCMSCGCCLEACPQFNKEESPPIGMTLSWDLTPSTKHCCSMNTPRAKSCKTTGWKRFLGVGGVNDCGNAQNCVKACPKEIPLTESIARIGRAATFHGLKRFFSGK